MGKEKKVLGREDWVDKGKVSRKVPLPYSICGSTVPFGPSSLGLEKSFYPLLSRPGSGVPKMWPVILPGVGGGSRFPVWPSLPLSASSAWTTPLTQFASCLQGGQ